MAIDTENRVFEKSTSNKIEILRNVIQPMDPINAEFMQYAIEYEAAEKIVCNNASIIEHTFNADTGIGFISLSKPEIENRMFYGSKMTSVKMLGITVIKEWSAFGDCVLLETVELPNTITEIKHSAFLGCANLRNINIPSTVTKIDHSVFKGCTSLTAVDLHSKIVSVSWYAFQGSGIESITLPASVTEIGNYAFQNCTSLTSVTFNSVQPPILMNGNTDYSTVFKDCRGDLTIYVPDESVDAYKAVWSVYEAKIKPISERK